KNRKKLKKSKIDNKSDKNKILIGLYVGAHHLDYYDSTIDKYLCYVKSKHVATIGSPPIFKSGFVIDKDEIHYVLHFGGRKTIKLDVYEVSENDFEDLETLYCNSFNLSAQDIETVVGKIKVLISDVDITHHCLISDSEDHDYYIRKIEGEILAKN